MWDVWCQYCSELAIDPLLEELSDPIPILQVYARRLRTGQLSPSRKQLRKRSVESYLRGVGQTFQALGTADPRQTWQGKNDFRLQRQLTAYEKADPPPHRVKPVPIQVIRRIMHVANSGNSPHIQATADMIALAFFFLLRPGEYISTSHESTPFKYCDAKLYCGSHLIPSSSTAHQLSAATFATLQFTTQKNGRKGMIIGLT